MTMCEMATAVQEQLAIKVAIINNGFLGMVRQWQEFFYGAVTRRPRCQGRTSSSWRSRSGSTRGGVDARAASCRRSRVPALIMAPW